MLTIRVITRLQDLTGDCTFTSLTIGDVVRWNGSAFVNTAQSGLTGIAHANLTGLTSGDDHTQYALLAGRSGGQTLIGGTAASNTLTLQSSSNATKGKILFGTSGYDEVNNRLGIGITSPTVALDVVGGFRVNLGNSDILSFTDLGSGATCQLLTSGSTRFSFQPNNTNSCNIYTGGVGISATGHAPTSPAFALHAIDVDSATTTIRTIAVVDHQSSGTPAAGFGTGITIRAKSSTTNAQDQAKITSEWIVATHASRTSRLKLLASDSGGDREGVRVESNGTVALLSFFGAAAVVQPAGVTAALATRTAGATYGATEQTMLQEAHDMARTLAVAIRALGLAA